MTDVHITLTSMDDYPPRLDWLLDVRSAACRMDVDALRRMLSEATPDMITDLNRRIQVTVENDTYMHPGAGLPRGGSCVTTIYNPIFYALAQNLSSAVTDDNRLREVVDVLIVYGANPDIIVDTANPLFAAVDRGVLALAELLIRRGCNPNIRVDGNTYSRGSLRWADVRPITANELAARRGYDIARLVPE